MRADRPGRAVRADRRERDVPARDRAGGSAPSIPGSTVEPVIADIAVELDLPRRIPRPALFAFLGSTIGNFIRAAAIRLLARGARRRMEPGDRFLLGVDLRKDIAR